MCGTRARDTQRANSAMGTIAQSNCRLATMKSSRMDPESWGEMEYASTPRAGTRAFYAGAEIDRSSL